MTTGCDDRHWPSAVACIRIVLRGTTGDYERAITERGLMRLEEPGGEMKLTTGQMRYAMVMDCCDWQAQREVASCCYVKPDEKRDVPCG